MNIYDNRALAAGVVSCDGGSIQLPDVVQSSLSSRGGLRGVKSPSPCHHGLLPVSPLATFVYMCICVCVCVYVCIHTCIVHKCMHICICMDI